VQIRQTIRKLRLEKLWYDEVIGLLEGVQRSRPVRALTLLDFHLGDKARARPVIISPRVRRRIWRLLQEHPGNGNGNGARRFRHRRG